MEKKEATQQVIGFAAETDLNEQMLLKKWNAKKVDLLIGTYVNASSDDVSGFKSTTATYQFLENGNVSEKMNLSKVELGHKIFEFIIKK